MLTSGFHDVPKGHLATVVTHLEMRAPAAPRPCPAPEGCDLRRVIAPEAGWYRDLYSRVGGEDWLWFSRLVMPLDTLQAILSDPDVVVFALERGGQALGFLELDYRETGQCELAFFGVTAGLAGGTAGRFLMNRAIAEAWGRDIARFHVHTCTLDHPRALDFYRRSGFVAYRQEVEIMQDPRLSGVLPRHAAGHIPIFD